MGQGFSFVQLAKLKEILEPDTLLLLGRLLTRVWRVHAAHGTEQANMYLQGRLKDVLDNDPHWNDEK